LKRDPSHRIWIRSWVSILCVALAPGALAQDGGVRLVGSGEGIHTVVDGGLLASRGVYFVNAALACPTGADYDGGACEEPIRLPEGWWLSRERMTITGERIVTLQNDLAAERAQREEMLRVSPPWLIAGVVGFCVGIGIGIAGMVYLGTKDR